MAKKKSPPKKTKSAKKSAPSKKCPSCGKTMHAATRTCKCGFEFPKKKKKRKKRARRGAAAVVSVSRRDGVLSQRLAESIKVIEKAGGLTAAKKMLSAVKELEK